KDFIGKRRFDVVLLGWTVPQDPDSYDVWHSSKTKPEELNFVSFKNKEVDKLLEDGRSTFDKNKRKQCYYRLQEILAEELPYIFLYIPDSLPAISSRFYGITPAPLGIDYNFREWFVPQDQQKYIFKQ
ncbi:MAG: peptide-binding protein, partial [Deltaproteobacteria bacterium]